MNNCYVCGEEISEHTDAYGSSLTPDEGDVSVCLYCAALGVWHDGVLVEPTPAERNFFLSDKRIVDVIALIKLEGPRYGAL